MIATDEKVAAVWREAVTALGESALITKAADEEDWLVSIGLKQDNMPFRTALQLLEPSGEEGWRLRPAVQDRAEGGRWITLELSGKSDSPDDSETVTSKVPLRFKLHKDAPDEWLPFFEERMRKDEHKWASALPDWAEAPAGLIKINVTDSEAWDFLSEVALSSCR